jgi:hypothetical protein
MTHANYIAGLVTAKPVDCWSPPLRKKKKVIFYAA